jgi:hypothetical protein
MPEQVRIAFSGIQKIREYVDRNVADLALDTAETKSGRPANVLNYSPVPL